ncbi:MAG: aminotransferase class V-fold PLP-dependent enzyme [Cyanobacteria bacterium]|nr:aminotransferase class V-fold PLP-dependent enzyme [Cyanobacteriota bacterium]
MGRDIGAANRSGDRPADRGALTAYTLEGLHANDLASLLDSAGICIRSGRHSTQPLHRRFSQEAFLNGASGQ